MLGQLVKPPGAPGVLAPGLSVRRHRWSHGRERQGAGTAHSLPSAGRGSGVTFIPVPCHNPVLPKEGRADGGKWLGPPQASCCEALAARWSKGNAERFSSGLYVCVCVCLLTHAFADHFLSSTEEETRTRRW